MKVQLALTMAAFAFQAHAHDKVGGGGDVLICKDQSGKETYRLLDTVEAEAEGRKLDLGGATLTTEQKIDLMAMELSLMDPVRAERYRQEAHKIHEDLTAMENGQDPKNNLAILYPYELEDIDDSKEIFDIPSNCVKKQLIRQDAPKSLMDPIYRFQKGLWKMMPTDERVAAYYHEVIYREFLSIGHKTSKSVRYFNSLLFTQKLDVTQACVYLDFLSRVGIPTVQYAGKVEFSTKPKVDYACDSNNALTMVAIDDASAFDNFAKDFKYRASDKLSFFIKNVKVEDGRMVSAKNFQNFGVGDGKIYPSDHMKDKYLYGHLEFVNDQRIVLRSAKKENGNTKVTFVFDAEGTILETIGESSELTQEQIAPFKGVLTDILECARRTIQKKNGTIEAQSNLADILLKTREALSRQDANELQSLHARCESEYEGYPKVQARKSKSEYFGFQKPNQEQVIVMSILTSLARVQVQYCKGFGTSVGGAVLVGARVGFYGLECLFSDAKRKRYISPMIAFEYGLGASTAVGKVELDAEQEDKGRLNLFGTGTDSNSDLGATAFFLIDFPSEYRSQGYGITQNHHISNGTFIFDDKSLKLGAKVGGNASAQMFIPLGKRKKEDWSRLLWLLTKEIIVPAGQ